MQTVLEERDSWSPWLHACPPQLPKAHTQGPAKRIAGNLGPKGKINPALHALWMICTWIVCVKQNRTIFLKTHLSGSHGPWQQLWTAGSTWGVRACVLLLDFYFIFPFKGQRHFSKAPTLWNYSQRNTFSLQEIGPRGPRDRSGLVWNLPSLSVSLPTFWLAFPLFWPVNATDWENSIFLFCGYS